MSSNSADKNVPWDVRVKLCDEAIAEELLEWGSPAEHTFTRAQSVEIEDDEGNKLLGIDVNTDCPDNRLNTLFCMAFSSLAEARWKRKCLHWRIQAAVSN